MNMLPQTKEEFKNLIDTYSSYIRMAESEIEEFKKVIADLKEGMSKLK